MHPLVLQEGFPRRVLRSSILLAVAAAVVVLAAAGLEEGIELVAGSGIAIGFLAATMWAMRRAQARRNLKAFGVAALVKYPAVILVMFCGFRFLGWEGSWLALGAGVVLVSIGLRLAVEIASSRSRGEGKLRA